MFSEVEMYLQNSLILFVIHNSVKCLIKNMHFGQLEVVLLIIATTAWLSHQVVTRLPMSSSLQIVTAIQAAKSSATSILQFELLINPAGHFCANHEIFSQSPSCFFLQKTPPNPSLWLSEASLVKCRISDIVLSLKS